MFVGSSASLVPAELKATLSGALPTSGVPSATAVGAASAVIVTGTTTVLVPLAESLTWSCTFWTPTVVNAWLGFARVDVPPSPKSHR